MRFIGSSHRHPGLRGAVVVALVVAGIAAPSGWAAPSKIAPALQIVATLPDLAALVQAVGGPHVHVTALATPNQDPHYVDPRPSLMLPLSRAHLLVVNGLQLEQGWLPPLIRGSRNSRIQPGTTGHLDASFFVQRLQVSTAPLSRAMGDVHPGGNPHFVCDPRASARVAKAIGERLAQLDPAHAAAYLAQTTAFVAQLTAIAKAQRSRFAKLPVPRRRIVSYHRSLPYLLDWLGLQEVATVEPRPGIPPSPAHTATVLTTMRQLGVTVLVQEEFYPRRVSQTLAKLVKGAVVVLPGGARFDRGETYVARLQRTTAALYAALGG